MGKKREKRTQGALRSTPGTGKELFRRGTSGAVPARRPLFPIRNGSPDRAEKPRFPVPENKKKTLLPLLISEPLAGSSGNPDSGPSRRDELESEIGIPKFRPLSGPRPPEGDLGPLFPRGPRCGQGSENRWEAGGVEFYPR
ncbi:hypothetical protein TNCT_175761 [Trichonephila clavata]|uniref:Uncharacterized protein n=1 Tax=Trichonephila clavata TaxID=2740835 RepID=A0A8X6LCQ9_TRICU|nr:hypothetical protein TNCT_175761 [Trichonephila clavata]